MSYSFKKLSEVALEQEATEANAIVEVGGEIKRMPMSAAAGGGGSYIYDWTGSLHEYNMFPQEDWPLIYDMLTQGTLIVFRVDASQEMSVQEADQPQPFELEPERAFSYFPAERWDTAPDGRFAIFTDVGIFVGGEGNEPS